MAARGLTSTGKFWLEHIEACGAARVSMKAYAERHGLNLQSFYCWKGQLKKLGALSPSASSTDANSFTPVTLAASPERDSKPPAVYGPGGPSARISLANGITIEVPTDISAEALGRLIRAAMVAHTPLADLGT